MRCFRSHLNRHYWLCAWLTAAMGIVCTQGNALNFDENHFNYDVWGEQSGSSRLLTPAHLMTDKQLFLSADAERDSSMPLHQKQLNHQWLYHYRHGNYDGISAIRKFFQTSFLNFYPQLLDESTSPNNIKTHNEYRAAFTDLNSYRLTLSGNKALLHFYYRF